MITSSLEGVVKVIFIEKMYQEDPSLEQKLSEIYKSFFLLPFDIIFEGADKKNRRNEFLIRRLEPYNLSCNVIKTISLCEDCLFGRPPDTIQQVYSKLITHKPNCAILTDNKVLVNSIDSLVEQSYWNIYFL